MSFCPVPAVNGVKERLTESQTLVSLNASPPRIYYPRHSHVLKVCTH
jgi:hypothetical protein